jgi:eukaryotic-like serine/threonine-protein kinase
VLFRLGRFADAEAEMADVIARRTRAEGPEDAATLRARTSYAEFLRVLSRPDESVAEFRTLTTAKTRLLGSEHPDTLYVHQKYAVGMYHQGRYREAEAELARVSDDQGPS